ncbi:hypothetical protein [Streptomyces sp. NPDC053427]|uniref:hypothetical protein n=1 Tax=Streptomyces sp. NPDC053427 TaxID=3365701 RepID=UPI0037D1E531
MTDERRPGGLRPVRFQFPGGARDFVAFFDTRAGAPVHPDVIAFEREDPRTAGMVEVAPIQLGLGPCLATCYTPDARITATATPLPSPVSRFQRPIQRPASEYPKPASVAVQWAKCLMSTSALWFVEQIVDGLVECGLSPERAVHGYRAIWYYTASPTLSTGSHRAAIPPISAGVTPSWKFRPGRAGLSTTRGNAVSTAML